MVNWRYVLPAILAWSVALIGVTQFEKLGVTIHHDDNGELYVEVHRV